VIANQDPNPLVAGSGIKKLKDAGVEIITGIKAAEGSELNRRFFTYIEKKRPYIILKWAQTADRFIARTNGDSKWISGPLSRQLVHKWRTEEDAVLVGSQTAIHDDPNLNVREWTGRNPVRIFIDRSLKVPTTHHLYDGSQRTICFNRLKDETNGMMSFVNVNDDDSAEAIVSHLYDLKIQSLIIEGGAQTLNKFISEGLWDEARIFSSTQIFGTGIAAPTLNGEQRSKSVLEKDELTIIFHR
jgi:diaminohydroxyphosphoribosylaminopyrimidine deaminase/5-amino-6-(5-phosphoribosylamino)uracil reductase